VAVNADGHARIGVSELRLRLLGRSSVVEKHGCVSMAEGVESAPRNFEFVENRHERLPHDIFRDEVMPPIVQSSPWRVISIVRIKLEAAD